MKFQSSFFLFILLTLLACESNDFKGSQQTEINRPSSNNSPTIDINQNTIPDDFEDPNFIVTEEDLKNEKNTPDLGKLYVPDGKGGFEEVSAIFKPTTDGIEKIDELLKKSGEDFFQVENPNNSNESNFPSMVSSIDGAIPDGFKEANEGVYIKTEEGDFVKIDQFFEPIVKNSSGDFTDPANLNENGVVDIPIIIIPDSNPNTTLGDEDPNKTIEIGTAKEECEESSIDFEDMLGSSPLTEVSNQYQKDFGVSFQLSDGTSPLLINHGVHTPTSSEFVGWVCNACTDGPPSTISGTSGTFNSLLENDKEKLGKFSIGGPNRNRFLIIDYSDPVNEASGTLIDVDGTEKWDVIAYNTDGNIVGKTTVESDNTGDGIGLDWKLKTLNSFVKLELKFSFSPGSIVGGGLALDLFSPSKACE